MSQALIPSSGGPPGPPSHQHAEPPKPGDNPLLLVHKLLRGRYWLAILLAGILGPVGAVAGYMAVKLEYTSNATIRIAPVLPKILFESDQNSMLPMFDSYLQTQVSLISSRRVMEMAMQSSIWREAGGEFSIEELEAFTENLRVVQPRNSQLILVSVTNAKPGRAQAGARAVVDAYMRIYGETDVVKENQRFQILEERGRSLRNEIQGLNGKIREVAHEYGSDDLSTAHEFEVTNLRTLQSELETAKLQLNSLESVSDDSESGNTLDYSKLSVEEIALIDGRMQRLVDERNNLQQEIASFESTLRRPESRPAYRRNVEALKSQESEIADYAKAFRENPLLAPTSTDESGRVTPAARTAAQLRSKVEGLQSLYEEAKERTVEIGRKNLELKGLRSELANLENSLNLTEARIEQLSLESSVSGRIGVLSEAELPTSPSNEKRRNQFAILGGLAGGGLGVGLVLALGFLNARIRDIGDAQEIKPRLLGALPLLPAELGNPTEALAAAQCVHQIRTMLHAHMPPQDPLCLTVTAANSGAGKTSFALSLGLSFASAGARTLIIDGDVVGTGLTRRTGASGRCKLGHVLRRYEVITEEESRHALQVAQQSGNRIGRALLELGYISESDLEEGLSMQKDGGLGLADALDGELVENCLADIGVPNLSILPASRRRPTQTHAMSPVAFRRLIDELRPSFDLILVDSGPVPGPTDATIMATGADGVIMVASRGDQGRDVQRALQHLHELNVPVVGLVFNRADNQDIERSKYSSSTMSGSKRESSSNGRIRENSPAELSEVLASVSDIGPLAQSVWLSTMSPAVFTETEVVS